MRLGRILLVVALLCAGSAVAQVIDDRMMLVEAIEEVRAAGVEITYSTQLVKDWMRVRSTPESSDPVAALSAALAEYDLGLEAASGDRWLVVKVERRRVTPAVAVDDTPPAPAAEMPPRLEEVVVVASRHAVYDQTAGSQQFLTGTEIRQLPHIADDVFRALHRLPGVAASDFQAPFNLRGGAIDEVKIRLNDLEIIEPYHMRTLFRPLSIVDPGIIEGAELLSGGFTADYGNHMSGVVNFRSLQSDEAPAHELGVSFVSAFARSKGAFADGRGSYLVSARRGYLDLIADQLTEGNEELDPRYSDLFASIRYSLTDSAAVTVNALLAEDDVELLDPDDGVESREDSTFAYAWLSLEAAVGSTVDTATTAFAGRVETTQSGFQDEPPEELITRDYDRVLDVAGIQTRIVWTPAERHMFRALARYRDLSAAYDYRLNSFRQQDFINGGLPVIVLRDFDVQQDGRDLGLAAAWRFRVTPRLVSELGMRWDHQDYSTEGDDEQVSPRVNLVYEASDRLELRAAWGEFHQPHAIQDLQVEDGDLTYYEAERAEHRILGLRYTFASGLDLTIDAYDKRYRELRPRYENLLDAYEFAPESNFDRRIVDPESGRAYGVETTLRSRGSDSIDWWLNYTWSKVYDEIEGVEVLRTWDQRHALTANVIWRLNRWTLSAVARYHSGWPSTPLDVTPVFDSAGNIVTVETDLTRRNQESFADYARLDLRASRLVPLANGSFEFYLELYNVFDAVNECCTTNHTLQLRPTLSVSPEIDEFLPRFPSFGFVWRFGPGAE